MPRPPGFHRASTLARFFFIHIYLYDLFRLSYTIYLDIPRIHHIAHISPLSASIFTSFTPFYSFRIGNSPPRHTEPLIISLLSRQSYVIHAENIFPSRSVYSTHISSPSRPILLPENLLSTTFNNSAVIPPNHMVPTASDIDVRRLLEALERLAVGTEASGACSSFRERHNGSRGANIYGYLRVQ